MPVNQNTKKFFTNTNIEIVIYFLIISSILIVYNQVGNFDFTIIDDNVYVYENNHVISGFSKENIKWAFSFSSDKTYWHPLSWFSHMFDCQLFGLDAGKHHIVNVCFHILNSILLFVVMKMMTGARWRSAFVALLFALHPLAVDSVAWIAERKNLLSSFFWMLTMISYVHYTRSPKFTRYLFTLTIFVLGLLAKPMLVTLPCVFFLLDYWPLRRVDLKSALPTGEYPQVTFSRLIYEKIPFLVFSLSIIGVSMFSLEKHNAVISNDSVSMVLRLSNALVSYVIYLKKMLLPLNLAIFYPFPKTLPVWQITGATLLLLFITLVAIRLLKRMPYIAVGWFWFLGTLVPVIGLVQGGLWPALADRWAYIPLVGIYLAFTWGMVELCKNLKLNKFFLILPASILLIIFAIVSRNQLNYWKDDVSLFKHTQNVTSSNETNNYFIGLAYSKQEKYDLAIDHFTEVLRLKPGYWDCHIAIGFALTKIGNQSQAYNHFAEALRLKPDSFDAHYNIAVVFFEKGDIENAVKHYLAGLRLKPYSEKALVNLGNIYLANGKTTKARDCFNKALKIKPSSVNSHYNLGIILAEQGNINAAIKKYEETLRLDPNFVEAHYSMGNALVTIGKMEEAINHFSRVLKIDPDFEQAHNILGACLAKQGKTDQAIKHYESALKLKPDYAEAHNNLAVALYNNRQIQSSMFHFREALRIRPDYQSAYNNLVAISNSPMMLNVKNNIKNLKAALEQSPKNHALIYNIGLMYSKLGDYSTALTEFQKALTIKPDFFEALDKMAILYVTTKNYDDAIRKYKKMTNLQPDNDTIYYNICCIYAKQENTDESVKFLKKAVDKGFDDWEYLKTDKDLEKIQGTDYYKMLVEKIN